MYTQKPKTSYLIPIIIIACIALYMVGAFTGYRIHQPSWWQESTEKPFYDGEGNVIPRHAVDSLVRDQFIKLSPAGMDTIKKYFHPIDAAPIHRKYESMFEKAD